MLMEAVTLSVRKVSLFPQSHCRHCIQDHDDKVSLIRYENWECGGQRGITELLVNQTNPDNADLVPLVLRVHRTSIDLNKELRFKKLLGEKTIENQILDALNYVDQSSLWFGFQDDANCVFFMLPYVAGVLRLADVESKRMFTQNCLVLSGPTPICNDCSRLHVQDSKRKRCKEEQMEVHPKCNNRCVTKEELAMQLKNEQKVQRNGEKREEYWRGKFQKECVAV